MNPELKQDWLAALRSGRFKQGFGQLYDHEDGCHCALGVLGHLLVEAGKAEWGLRGADLRPVDLPRETECHIPVALTDLSPEDQQFIVGLNDGERAPLDAIAGWIEANVAVRA